MKSFKDYFLNEAVAKTKTIEADEINKLMDEFKYSKSNTSVWRRKDYTNLAVALSDDIYLYYLPNLGKISIVYNDSKYDVSYNNEYFRFADKAKHGNKLRVYITQKGQAYKDILKFFKDLDAEFISGKSFKDGKETNAMEIATDYDDLNW